MLRLRCAQVCGGFQEELTSLWRVLSLSPATLRIVSSHSVPPVTPDSASTRNRRLLLTLRGHAHLHWPWTGFGGLSACTAPAVPKAAGFPCRSAAWWTAQSGGPLPGLPPVSAGGPVPTGSSFSHQHTHASIKTHSSVDDILLPLRISHTWEYCVRLWLGNLTWLPGTVRQEEKQHSPSQQSSPAGLARLGCA